MLFSVLLVSELHQAFLQYHRLVWLQAVWHDRFLCEVRLFGVRLDFKVARTQLIYRVRH